MRARLPESNQFVHAMRLIHAGCSCHIDWVCSALHWCNPFNHHRWADCCHYACHTERANLNNAFLVGQSGTTQLRHGDILLSPSIRSRFHGRDSLSDPSPSQDEPVIWSILFGPDCKWLPGTRGSIYLISFCIYCSLDPLENIQNWIRQQVLWLLPVPALSCVLTAMVVTKKSDLIQL